jgi:hypothetical protein
MAAVHLSCCLKTIGDGSCRPNRQREPSLMTGNFRNIKIRY